VIARRGTHVSHLGHKVERSQRLVWKAKLRRVFEGEDQRTGYMYRRKGLVSSRAAVFTA
jgi:hypothetical protein